MMKQELLVMFAGLFPILEVRGAIPLGLAFGFSLPKAYILGVLGNMIPIMPVLFFLGKFSLFLMHRWYWYNRLMNWVIDRTQKRHLDGTSEKEWGILALFFFVAIPFPLTGAWSGMIVAHILGISFWRSVLAIFLGIMTSGTIVSILISMGILAVKNIT